ncbi:aromatic ring-hydroxylating oxygenase subunit alpha [Sphingomonas phyllosphaerae]|uniref:aromatic ring-hydroxylating oxygenase subunit alpha n=1 Tax=Sphingomonas phyllosphaerae TaxID=257003 RepID=UPI0024138ED2|nr:SRPBCC family protein [Sphingomonas phyllosphaerae]
MAALPNQEFIASLNTSAIDLADAETLPPACYTDAGFYEFEKEALFFHEWLCVGRESWVAGSGDYFTTTIVGEPIVVARGRDGKINAMSSVCAHRAMLVAEGAGNTRMFLCPYHHWAYGLDGKLVGAPAMEKTCNFQKEDHGLATFKVELWQGFIFVNFDLQAAPLAPRLAAVTEAIAGYDLASAEGEKPGAPGVFAWNWKVMFENNNDGYHASKLHQGPLHDFVPSELSVFPDADPADAGFLRYNGTLHQDASFNATQKALLPVFPELDETARSRMTFANIPPTLSLVMMSDMVIYLILRPTGPETMEQDTGVLVAPGASKHPSFAHKMAMNMTAASHIIDQDMHVDGLVQVGLRSRFAPRGRYSWQEGAQIQFNRWLVTRYRDTWDRLNGGARPVVRAA